MTKPILVWVVPAGPNPWKVIWILEELGVPYDLKSFKFDDVKRKPFTDVNPNGRVPAIQDPNTDVTVWETGAIIQYLIRQYDSEKRLLSYDTLKEQTHCDQWLMFQVSGQGPYYGQAGWFAHLHPERLPSAYERYATEIKRILGVLEGVLAAKPEPQWLVGDKVTFADLAFVPWNERADVLLGVEAGHQFDDFPTVKAWHERMINRPAWKKIMGTRAVLMDEQGLDWNGMPKGTTNFQEYESGIAAETKKLAEEEAKKA